MHTRALLLFHLQFSPGRIILPRIHADFRYKTAIDEDPIHTPMDDELTCGVLLENSSEL